MTTTDQSGTLAMASNTTAACDLAPGSSTPFGQHPKALGLIENYYVLRGCHLCSVVFTNEVSTG